MSARLVGGRFAVGELLGSGGTASVHSATDLDGTVVAVKLLHPHLAVAPTMWDAFFEEVRAAEGIPHPGIARVLDYGVDDGDAPVAWIAMEFIAGRTLAQVVAERGPLSQADALGVAAGLLGALSAAHRGGVVHRDVSPANVMLDSALLGTAFDDLAASVRLLDFGLADIPGRPTAGADALLSGIGEAAGVVASVPYATPEHMAGEAVTEASDVYQAACTVFFAVTGRPPFTGDRDAMIRGHLREQPPVPSRLRAGVSAAVDRWLLAALAKEPARRYVDASSMRAAMPRIAGEDAVGARPYAAQTDLEEQRTRFLPVAAPATTVSEGIPRGARPRPRVSGWIVATAGGLAIAGIVAYAAVAGSSGPIAVPTDAPQAGAPTTSATQTAQPTPTSTAVELEVVPEIDGLSLAEANARLSARGFALGAVERVDAARSVETVLGSDPAQGTQVTRGAAVVLRVASGNNGVPPVVGMTVNDAIAALSAEGFSAAIRSGGSGDAGVVAGSEPGSGTSLSLGSTVVLFLPDPRPTATPTAAPPTPAPSASPIPTATPASGGSR